MRYCLTALENHSEIVLQSRMSGLDFQISHKSMYWKTLTDEKILCNRIKTKRHMQRWRREICISTKFIKQVM